MAALTFMVGAKLANVGVPLLLKELVDTMNPKGTLGAQALLVVPLGLLLAAILPTLVAGLAFKIL